MRGTRACSSSRSRRACWGGPSTTRWGAWWPSPSTRSNPSPSPFRGPTPSTWSTSTWGTCAPERGAPIRRPQSSNQGAAGGLMKCLFFEPQPLPFSFNKIYNRPPVYTFSLWWKWKEEEKKNQRCFSFSPLITRWSPQLRPRRWKAAIPPFGLHSSPCSPSPHGTKRKLWGGEASTSVNGDRGEGDWCATEVGAAGSSDSKKEAQVWFFFFSLPFSLLFFNLALKASLALSWSVTSWQANFLFPFTQMSASGCVFIYIYTYIYILCSFYFF